MTHPHPTPPARSRQAACRKMRWLMLSPASPPCSHRRRGSGHRYRVFRSDGSAQVDVTALLPKGAKIVGTRVAGDRIAVIVDVAQRRDPHTSTCTPAERPAG